LNENISCIQAPIKRKRIGSIALGMIIPQLGQEAERFDGKTDQTDQKRGIRPVA
jgi:hypothetical protein